MASNINISHIMTYDLRMSSIKRRSWRRNAAQWRWPTQSGLCQLVWLAAMWRMAAVLTRSVMTYTAIHSSIRIVMACRWRNV